MKVQVISKLHISHVVPLYKFGHVQLHIGLLLISTQLEPALLH
jgi:hypothetical protein